MPKFRSFLPCILHGMLETHIPQGFLATRGPKLGAILAKIESVLVLVRIHQHAAFQAIPSMHSPWNVWKPQFHHFYPRGPRWCQHWLKSNNFWTCSATISMSYLGPFLQCTFLKMVGSQNFIFYLNTRGLKLGHYYPTWNTFFMWSGYISMPHMGPSLPCVLLQIVPNPNLINFVITRGSELGRYWPKLN